MPEVPVWSEARIAAEFQAGMEQRLRRVRAFGPVPTQLAPAQAFQLMQLMHEAEQFVGGFADRAESLRRQGLPALSAQVSAAFTDIGQAKIRYLEMYRDAMVALSGMDRAASEARQHALREVLAASYHQRVVFAAGMHGIQAVQRHECATCGMYLGDAYPYFRWCPHCRTRM